MRRGVWGYDVEALRRALIHEGLRKYGSPGGFTLPMRQLLEDQVRHFQRIHGISPSGVVGDATFEKLQRVGAYDRYGYYLIEQERKALAAANANRVANLVVASALQGASRTWEPVIHYSQKQDLRWRGIHFGWLAPHNQPDYADCSSYTTWLIWQALVRVKGHPGPDIVNGDNWQAGFTGTQLEHGQQVKFERASPGRSLIFYTARKGGPVTHVVMFVGTLPGHGPNCVVSHGQENGPRIARANYRDYYHSTRTYPI
jgi:Putative peptidoglycan binding domain